MFWDEGYGTAIRLVDKDGATFISSTVVDTPGKPAPFPETGSAACGISLYEPLPCTDVVVYKFSASGEFVFATYLEGRTNSEAVFLDLAPDGSVVAAGNTDSSDFPSTPTALQPNYGGPPRVDGRFDTRGNIGGDFFAARLDPLSGELLASTFLGGPNADQMGIAELGPDGSLYFLHKWLGRRTTKMPTSPSALMTNCPDPCGHGYAARLSPTLDQLLYGTYLPGTAQATAALHSDGSVYYAGSSGVGLPTTPGAYKPEPAGGIDGFVARLDPQGEALLFATYVGGPDSDSVLRMAVAPDGSVWAAVSSFVECCVDIDYRLVRFDASGERILTDVPIDVGDIAVGPDGNLRAIASGDFIVSPDAFLGHVCAAPDLAYLTLSPEGVQLFASYLPAGSDYDFAGTGERGLPLLSVAGRPHEVVEDQPPGMLVGCLVDAASFTSSAPTPGQIVTLFGSGLGPEGGVAFELDGGRVPTSLAGVRVLIDGTPAPILYASYWQINAIVPYSLAVNTLSNIEVEYLDGRATPSGLYFTERAAIQFFRLNDSSNHPAAALNQDGTVNTTGNPAKPGSVVTLFGTGGGATVPPSEAVEVTPLELRPMELTPEVRVFMPDGEILPVEFAGGAPGLVAGVTQINIRLPDEIPVVPDFPSGLLPLWVRTPGSSSNSGWVTIAVAVE